MVARISTGLGVALHEKSVLLLRLFSTKTRQSLIWFKIFVKQKKSLVCIEEIKFAIISEFFSPVNFGILSSCFILVDFPI